MEQTLEIIGTLVGLLYLWLEYKASIYLWIAGIIMPAIYIFVYYNAGLYADFGINIYYLGAAIYGWMMWKYGAFLRRTILKKTALSAAAHCRICRHVCRHCLDTHKLYRQQCPLAGFFHHRTKYHRHVDAGAEIRRAMVGMDWRGCRKRRPVRLQRT